LAGAPAQSGTAGIYISVDPDGVTLLTNIAPTGETGPLDKETGGAGKTSRKGLSSTMSASAEATGAAQLASSPADTQQADSGPAESGRDEAAPESRDGGLPPSDH
jgi:hypothetical protein